MRPTSTFFASLLALGLWSSSGAAQTEDAKAKAKARFVRGIDRMEAEDYAGAVGEFERAYEHAPFAVILFNLGIAYAKLDRPVKAVEVLERVVAEPGSLSPQRVAQAKETIAAQGARIGRVAVKVDVDGAKVRVDGVDVGVAPLTLSLRSGLHFVEAVKVGYAPSRREVSVAGDAQAEVTLSLEATADGLGQLWVRSDLPGAEVLLDGKRVGTTPLTSSIPVVPGDHDVELRREGYRRASNRVSVGVGATAEVSLEPRPDRSAIAKGGSRLALTGDEASELVVTLDGERVGLYASPIALAPGPHAILIERGGYLATEVEVDVPKGETLTQVVSLEPTPETIEAHDASVTDYRIAAWSTLGVGVALIGAGVGYTVYNEGVRADKEDEFEAQLAPGERCSMAGLDDPYCVGLAEDIDAAGARRPIGYALMGAGAASAIASIIVFAVMPDPDRFRHELDEDAEQVFGGLQPTWCVTPSAATLGVVGVF